MKMKNQWLDGTSELVRHRNQPINRIETNKCLLYVVYMENDPK